MLHWKTGNSVSKVSLRLGIRLEIRHYVLAFTPKHSTGHWYQPLEIPLCLGISPQKDHTFQRISPNERLCLAVDLSNYALKGVISKHITVSRYQP